MHAVIHEVPGVHGISMVPVAGRPLIARQLQWLRALGITEVAVGAGTDESCLALVRWLVEGDALGVGVVLVLAGRPLGPLDVARRAWLATSFLAVPAHVLADSDLSRLLAELKGRATIVLSPPPGLAAALPAGTVRLYRAGRAPARFAHGPGWGVRVRNAGDALTIAAEVLAGHLPGPGEGRVWPIQVHGRQAAPGVWQARGARIDPGAHIRPPVYLGTDALVCARAVVGPAAFVGDRAVIERGASVARAVIGDDTLVGTGAIVRDAVATPGHLTDLRTGASEPLADPGALDHRDLRMRLAPRLAATLLLLVLVPVLLVLWAIARAARRQRLRERVVGWPARLLDVCRGLRTLVGVGPLDARGSRGSAALLAAAGRAPLGAIDIEPALGAAALDETDRLRLRAWYAGAKSFMTDARLVLRRLLEHRTG